MKKKLGPLPLWAWIAILAVAGFTLYRYEKNKSESTGVEEGFFPTQGIPAEGAEGVARRMPAMTHSHIVMNEKTVANQMNAASQILARLMRPSKLNRSQFQSIYKTPGGAICPLLGHAPAAGPARCGTNSSSLCWSH